jgi:hypothetical protein
MINLVLVTSVINTCDKPLSYINKRSVYSMQERFEQTKLTIQSIKDKIPNCKILLSECSKLSEIMTTYLQENCDYFINYYENLSIRQNVESQSKSLGENTLIANSIHYLKSMNVRYDNLLKISGRYWLSENFNYANFQNNQVVATYINNMDNNAVTSLFKIPKNIIDNYTEFLNKNVDVMLNCIGAEVLFAIFLKTINPSYVKILPIIGVNGLIAVSNDMVSS